LRARTESENATRSSAESIEEEAQIVDEEEEEDGGDSGERREVGRENKAGSGEEKQVEPALSGGISCPRPLQEIFSPVFATDKAILSGIVATGSNPEHPAAAAILATDVRPVSTSTSDARDPNTTFQKIPAECSTGCEHWRH
jgi:hypothetical protein